MTDRTQDAEATDLELEQVQQAARAMLAALKRVNQIFGYDRVSEELPEVHAAIAQAEKAGIKI